MSYMYIMQCKNFIKIGVSKLPKYRIKELQIGNPFEIKLMLKLKFKNPYYHEKQFHKQFKNKHERGEWFKIDDDIITFVRKLKQYEYEELGGNKQ